jgi:hypothetical protein
MEDETGKNENNTQDGINVDSDVIVSEYRLLYLKYKEQINKYKEAIANLSLKQIINNEEEAWVEHRANLGRINQSESENMPNTQPNLQPNNNFNCNFDQEIMQLSM